MIKKILLVLLGILVVLQFFRPEKNRHEGAPPAPLASLHTVPPNVAVIIDKACNDCHSNNTRYPWYSEVQPVAWWLSDHIKEGKKELNFDEFGSYSLRKQAKKMQEIAEEVKEGKMPLKSYVSIHEEAKLTEAERQTLVAWALEIERKIGLPRVNPKDEGTK